MRVASVACVAGASWQSFVQRSVDPPALISLRAPLCWAHSCVSSLSQVWGAVDACPGSSTGLLSWMHLSCCENTLAQAASQSSCLTAGQTLHTKSKQSSGKPALNFEYFGTCFAVVAIREVPSLLIFIMSGEYTEIKLL